MRITSPPKHPSEINKAFSPLKVKSDCNIPFQTQNRQHSSNLGKNPVKIQSKNVKEKMYEQLKNRQQQYVQLIKELHQQNRELKAQLGKLNFQQPKRQSISTILHHSPDKNDLNQVLYAATSDFKFTRKNWNQGVMNQTFGNFGGFRKQSPSNIRFADSNLSPFAKKALLLQNVSPTAFRKSPLKSPLSFQKIPSNRTVSTIAMKSVQSTMVMKSPQSSMVMKSPQSSMTMKSPQSSMTMKSPQSSMTMKSPQRKALNHNYTPSLIRYESATPQSLSLNCSYKSSPKKSSQDIIDLNSQISSNQCSQSSQYNKQNNLNQHRYNATCQIYRAQQQLKQGLFDIKKKQVNQAWALQKGKNTDCSKNMQTVSLIGTQNIFRNQQTQIALEDQNTPLNPLTYKGKHQTGRARAQLTDDKQVKQAQNKDFNLKERISKNPLMNMLSKKLQQEGQMTNGKQLQEGYGQPRYVPLEISSQCNENIRNSSSEGDTYNQPKNILYNPLKRNTAQGSSKLQQLTNVQQNHVEQAKNINQTHYQRQNLIENDNDSSNHIGRYIFEASRQSRISTLSDKVKTQAKSQYIIGQVECCRQVFTIVNLLDQDLQKQDKSNLTQDQLHPPEKQNIQEVNCTQIQKEQIQSKNGELLQSQGNLVPITNTYYGQKAQNDKQSVYKSLNVINKKVSINENYNITKTLQSNKDLNGSYIEQSRNLYSEQQQIFDDQIDNQNNPWSHKSKEQHQMSSTQSDRQKMNKSSQFKYHRVGDTYDNQIKQRQNSQISNDQPCAKQKRLVQRCQQNGFDSSLSSLRCQRFRKISNKAYL